MGFPLSQGSKLLGVDNSFTDKEVEDAFHFIDLDKNMFIGMASPPLPLPSFLFQAHRCAGVPSLLQAPRSFAMS